MLGTAYQQHEFSLRLKQMAKAFLNQRNVKENRNRYLMKLYEYQSTTLDVKKK